MAFVIDASVIAALAFEDASNQRVVAALERLKVEVGFAPALFHFEVRNALVVKERRGRTTAAQSTEFLFILARWPIHLEPIPEDDAALLRLARTRDLTVYDAAYLELAKREALPLATLDRDLERAARAERVALVGA